LIEKEVRQPRLPDPPACGRRDFFIENLLIQIGLIIVMIRWTGLAPWELESPFLGSLTSTFLAHAGKKSTLKIEGSIFDSEDKKIFLDSEQDTDEIRFKTQKGNGFDSGQKK